MYTIDPHTLEDARVFGRRDRMWWEGIILHDYPNTLIKHEVVELFRHFMCTPTSLVFFIDGGHVMKEAVVAKTRVAANVDVAREHINPLRHILLTVDGLGAVGDEFRIRFAEAEHDLI